MKALISRDYGPIDRLTIADIPTPAPGAGQVLLRVQAAAVNPQDIRLITGEARDVMPVRHPFIPGVDAAGVVEAVGDGVTRFAPGDEVVAFTGYVTGTFAERVVLADGPGIAHRPAGVDALRGAALPTAAMTAAALLDAAQSVSRQSVLVVGATGGVGSFTVQLAAQAGAEVLVTADPTDADYMRGLGALHTIDYTSVDTTQEALALRPAGVDIVIDLINAGPLLATTAIAARQGGRLLSTLGGPDRFDRGVAATYVRVQARDRLLQDLTDRVADGKLTVEISAVYPFAGAAEAVADFAAKHVRGKIVVQF